MLVSVIIPLYLCAYVYMLVFVSIYICLMCLYVQVYMRACVYVLLCVYLCFCVYVFVKEGERERNREWEFVWLKAYLFVVVSVCVNAYVCIYVYDCMCVFMCVCVCAYVCVSIHKSAFVYVCLKDKILVSLSEFIQTPSLSVTLFVSHAYIHIYINTQI